MNKKLDRYTRYLQAKGEQDFTVLSNKSQIVKGFPELVACPDARVKIGGNEYVLIFSDVSGGLKNREVKTIEQGLETAADTLPVYRSHHDLHLKWDDKSLYEAAGLLQAFPEAFGCKLVLFGISDIDIEEVIIPRLANIHDEKYPAMRRSIKSLADMFTRLRRFYFGALLPELAFPRKIHGLPLRSKLVEERVIAFTVKECTGKSLEEYRMPGNTT